MARKINLKNISVDTLVNMSYDDLLAYAKRGLDKDSMTRKKYRKAYRNNIAEITSRLVSASNKRIKLLGRSKIGQASPAYQDTQRMSKTGLFSVKGKNYNQLLHTIKETKQFLARKTSTVKGWKEVRTAIEENIGGSLDSTFKSHKFWEVYRRIQETYGDIIVRKKTEIEGARITSDRVQQMLYNTFTDPTRDTSGKRVHTWKTRMDEIYSSLKEELRPLYEESKKSKDLGSSRNIKNKE